MLRNAKVHLFFQLSALVGSPNAKVHVFPADFTHLKVSAKNRCTFAGWGSKKALQSEITALLQDSLRMALLW
jgi:hypothetical protein